MRLLRGKCKTCSAAILLCMLLAGSYIFNEQEQAALNINEGTALLGRAYVHDGDSFRLAGRKIRLWAIDAPELDQTCGNAAQKWDCGQEAKHQLERLIHNQVVKCHAKSTSHDRLVAQCFVGETDLSKHMVTSGYAVALPHISKAYMADEKAASKARRGQWRSVFDKPWQWRNR